MASKAKVVQTQVKVVQPQVKVVQPQVKVVQPQLPTPPSSADSRADVQGPLCPQQPAPLENEETTAPKPVPKSSKGEVKAEVLLHQNGGRLFDTAPKTVTIEPRRRN